MRRDMNKVLTERPRLGGSVDHSPKYDRKARPRQRRLVHGRRFQEDYSPKRESMRRRYGYDGKIFNDHLSPLWRFLQSRRGQPWNKVWSEVCAVLRGNGWAARHVKEHVQGLVGSESWQSFYIDRHGFLRQRKDT